METCNTACIIWQNVIRLVESFFPKYEPVFHVVQYFSGSPFLSKETTLRYLIALGLREEARSLLKSYRYGNRAIYEIMIALLYGEFEVVKGRLAQLKILNTVYKKEILGLFSDCIYAFPDEVYKLLGEDPTKRKSVERLFLSNFLGLEWIENKPLNDPGKRTLPDEILFDMNTETSPAEKLKYLNRYFDTFQLERLSLIDNSRPIFVDNLQIAQSVEIIKSVSISVIIANYNTEGLVGASISSLLRSGIENIEIIVIDDCSTDMSWSKIKKIGSSDNRVKCIRLIENVGTYIAKNIGMRFATGKYIAFQDADDFSHSDRLRVCISSLEKNNSLTAVSALYLRIDDTGKITSPKIYPLLRWTPISMVFHRDEVMCKLGYFDNVRFGADSEFFARIRAVFGEVRIKKIRVPLLLCADRAQSLTKSSDTGFNAQGYSELRAMYQEQWTRQMIQKILDGDMLYRECLKSKEIFQKIKLDATMSYQTLNL